MWNLILYYETLCFRYTHQLINVNTNSPEFLPIFSKNSPLLPSYKSDAIAAEKL